MYLGELITRLEAADLDQVVAVGFDRPHSYRGYYERLAFEPRQNVTVGAMLTDAKKALGTTYEGYKGGEYTMGENTEVYISYYGTTGEELGSILLGYMLGTPIEAATEYAQETHNTF